MAKRQVRWAFWIIGWEAGKGPTAKPAGTTVQHWPTTLLERKAHKLLDRPEIRRDSTLIGGYYVGSDGTALICCPPTMDPLTY